MALLERAPASTHIPHVLVSYFFTHTQTTPSQSQHYTLPFISLLCLSRPGSNRFACGAVFFANRCSNGWFANQTKKRMYAETVKLVVLPSVPKSQSRTSPRKKQEVKLYTVSVSIPILTLLCSALLSFPTAGNKKRGGGGWIDKPQRVRQG